MEGLGTSVNYVYDNVAGMARPTLYPGEKGDNWDIPEEVNDDFRRLNTIIENKYSREFLKICAFYNKMFPSLKISDWITSSYNVQSFTSMDQERKDTGSGISFNYLKQIVDQITSRLGTITFVPALISEDTSLEYIVYKDEVERILRVLIRNDDFNRKCLEVFHNAAVIGYSHVFIDPYTGKLIKANDFEIGIFEGQLNKGAVSQMLYRDYAFPVSEAMTYLVDCDEQQRKELLECWTGRSTVDFKMYFDCPVRKVYVTIDNKTLPAKDYDYDTVLMTTFSWDTGFTKCTTTSLFDLLYPLQREINKIAAKVQQLIRMYKGPVPVFNSDVDIAMKSISNGTGEALYIDSSRSTSELMTVINPTPLDPQLSAEITNYKVAMYELAGIQNASFDMENMRSAAAVVALDQTRDSVFQAQLSGMAQFIKSALMLYIRFFAKHPGFSKNRDAIDWAAVAELIDRSYINLQPVHLNDPLSDEDNAMQKEEDYIKQANSRLTLDIIRGKVTYNEVPMFIDRHDITEQIALTLVKFEALGVDVPDTVHIFLMDAFIDAIKNDEVVL